ncbi:hypothetical protein FS749_014880 [Ceratobasidium sp. UAMH 11750]|nr:hypothetical protein FS749_014880 [Ceratobasidium sp. UAMH 11750]
MEEGEEQYKVKNIVGWEQKKDGLYYGVKWKGYDSLENMMEQAEKIVELKQVMSRFLKKHPGAPIPKNYKREEGKTADTRNTALNPTPPCLLVPLQTPPHPPPNSGITTNRSATVTLGKPGHMESPSTQTSNLAISTNANNGDVNGSGPTPSSVLSEASSTGVQGSHAPRQPPQCNKPPYTSLEEALAPPLSTLYKTTVLPGSTISNGRMTDSGSEIAVM